MSQNAKGHFKLIKNTLFRDMSSDGFIVPESDLCFQDQNSIYQFEYVKPKTQKKLEVKPGIYNLTKVSGGVINTPSEFKAVPLLEEIDNTKRIVEEARNFFGSLHVYEELEQPKLRGALVYSKPGMGKSSAISKFCRDFAKEDTGTVILNWPTSELDADDVSTFFSNAEFKGCTRLVLVIEDIGGGERSPEYSSDAASAGLLNLLDGVNVTFKLPTFIIATTNFPENLLGALANRPGRFDLLMELLPPAPAERLKLVEFIAKRKLTKQEREALMGKKTDNFSIAHLKEIVIRSRIKSMTISEAIEQLYQHGEKFKSNFKETKSMGFGFHE